MFANICRVGISPTVASLTKTSFLPKPMLTKLQPSRLFANDGRTSFTRSARSNQWTAKKSVTVSPDIPFAIGRIALGGASIVGLGSLCYYGLGLSKEVGAIEEMTLWPHYVKERIKATYMYIGGSLMLTAASAVLCFRSPHIIRFVTRDGWVSLATMLVATVGSGMLLQSIPYKEGFGMKQLAWMAHTGLLGAFIAPVCFMGGPLVMKAALYTAGIVGGLSTVAVCAPSEKFLNMAGPLSIGLAAVAISSLGTFFLPPTTGLGAGIYAIAIYGGLILFSGFLLYDTQKIIKRAQVHPTYYDKSIDPYDPVNNAISLYLDVIQIFIRILTLQAFQSKRR